MTDGDFKFKIGDLVIIKSWEEMEEEFGLENDGDIACQYEFTEEMRRDGLCGTEFVISNITPAGQVFGSDTGYMISCDMIELYEEEELEESEGLNTFLSGLMVGEYE